MIFRIPTPQRGLPLPPSYSPFTIHTTYTYSLSLSISRDRCVIVNTRNTHVRAPTWCVHARVLPSSLRRGIAHVPSRARKRGRGWVRENWRMRVLSFSVSYFPPSSVSSLEGKRDETSRVQLHFVIFFSLCGALNRLLVRAGVYTRWAIGRTIIGDVPVCMSEEGKDSAG